MASYFLLSSALARLDLDLEQELKRYKQEQNSENILANELSESSEANQDLEFAFEPIFEQSLERDTQAWELSYDDDISDPDSEITLEEEFQGKLQTIEFTEELTQNYTQEVTKIPTDEVDQNPKETTSNMLSPLGVIAMILLLLSSATVGYLLVDPSGLNKLFKQDSSPKPVSLLDRVELFQIKGASRIEQIPFVEFTNKTNKTASKSQGLPSQTLALPPISNTIGMGRSFEAPIRVEPEVKIKVESTAKVIKSQPQPVDSQKIDKNSPQLNQVPIQDPLNPLPNAVRSPLPLTEKLNPIKPLISKPVVQDPPPESPKPSNENELKPEVSQE